MAVKRNSISVPEMGRWLGLGKTRTYDVLRENNIETIKVGNGVKKYTRVMLDSFEEWYAGQTHYKKVSEECPIGASFYHPTPDPRPVDEQIQEIFGDRIVYTVEEAKMFLSISRTVMYDLVALKLFPSTKVNNKHVIPADLFHEWAEKQTLFSLSAEYDLRKEMMARYKGCFFNQQEGKGEPINLPKIPEIPEDQEESGVEGSAGKKVVMKDLQMDGATIPVAVTVDADADMDEALNEAELMMLRNIAAVNVQHSSAGKNSSEQDTIEQLTKLLNRATTENAPAEKPKMKNYYMVGEVARMMNCPLSRVYKLVDTNTIRSKKVGPRVLIFKKEFDEWLRNSGK